MSGWEEFKNDASKIVSKAAVKARELTDAAASCLKLQGMKLRLCEEYEKLGRLTYKAEKNGTDTSACAEVIRGIDNLRTAIKKIENDTAARREEHEASGSRNDETTADDNMA